MKTTFGLACALSLLTVMNTATAQSGDYLAALVATRSSDAASATSYLANALEKDPDERALIRQQMQILTIEGDFDAALPYAQDFLAIDSQDALAQTIVRIEAIRRDDWPTALATLPLAAESRLDAIIEAITYASVLTGNGQADQALIKVEAVNFEHPEIARDKRCFDHLTPPYPAERRKLALVRLELVVGDAAGHALDAAPQTLGMVRPETFLELYKRSCYDIYKRSCCDIFTTARLT